MSDADPDGLALIDVLPSPDPSPEAEAVDADLRRRLADRMMARLDDRQRAVLFARFSGWTLEDTGRSCGLSRERVRQVEREAGAKLAAEDWPPPEPMPPGRPRREHPEADPRHARMRELWDRLRSPSLLSNERERLEAEHRELAAALRVEGPRR